MLRTPRTKPPRPAREGSEPETQSLELSRHLLRAQEEERKRIGRELHDGTGQGLMVLRLYLGMLASENQSPEAQLKIEEAMKLLDQTIEELRRIISRLSPRVLEELGLLAAIRKEVRDFTRNTEIKARLEIPKALAALDHEIEIAVYRLLQEALHNIAKHSQAQNFSVLFRREDGSVCLLIEDDGVGFAGKRVSRVRGSGLMGMRDRVTALGGKMRVRSDAGSGTQIKIVLPAKASIRKEDAAEQSLPRSANHVAPGQHTIIDPRPVVLAR
jgi:two-component system sensor histidine kinase UhpB